MIWKLKISTVKGFGQPRSHRYGVVEKEPKLALQCAFTATLPTVHSKPLLVT